MAVEGNGIESGSMIETEIEGDDLGLPTKKTKDWVWKPCLLLTNTFDLFSTDLAHDLQIGEEGEKGVNDAIGAVNRVLIPTVIGAIRGGEAVVAVGIATKEIARGPMNSTLFFFHFCMIHHFNFMLTFFLL